MTQLLTRPATACQKQIDTPLGKLTLVVEDDLLTGIYFEGHQPAPKLCHTTPQTNSLSVFEEVESQLQQYFNGSRTDFDLPLTFQGTEFQESVWSQLQQIPAGKTISYQQIAKAIRRPDAVRAVGSAVGRNPISIVIPCHRVVRTSGELGGFAGGLDRKRWLLNLEQQQ